MQATEHRHSKLVGLVLMDLVAREQITYKEAAPLRISQPTPQHATLASQ